MIMYVLTILLESITIWICLYSVFNEKIKISYLDCIYFVVEIVFFAFCNIYVNLKIYTYLFPLFIYFFCFFKFKEGYIATFLKTVCGVGIALLIELLTTLILGNSFNIYNNDIKSLIIVFISMLFSFIGYSFIKMNNKFSKKEVNTYFAVILALVFTIIILYIKLDVEKYRSVDAGFYLILMILAFLFCISYTKIERYKKELDNNKLELELRSKYDNIYNNIIDEIRRKQHDYKNQLSAIYSLHYTAVSLEELIKEQENYADELLKRDKYDFIMSACENHILAGYIYQTCINFDKQKIDININLSIYSKCFKIYNIELIEILGVIFNNACEYLGANDVDKKIYFTFIEKNDYIEIEIKNICGFKTQDEIINMFSKGYSSKEKHSGIGLFSLKKIVDKYNGKIIVFNDDFDNENWLCFKIIINK